MRPRSLMIMACVLAVGLALQMCGSSKPGVVFPKYAPLTGIRPAPGQTGLVGLEVTDYRPYRPKWSDGRDRVGGNLYTVLGKDVAGTVADAYATGLAQAGFQNNPSAPRKMLVQVQVFDIHYPTGTKGMARVETIVKVLDQGRLLVERKYNRQVTEGVGAYYDVPEREKLLSVCLSDVVEQTFLDPAVLEALKSGGVIRPPQAAPAGGNRLEPAGPPARPVPSGVEQRLMRLKELKDKGLITDEEYNYKRKEILKDL